MKPLYISEIINLLNKKRIINTHSGRTVCNRRTHHVDDGFCMYQYLFMLFVRQLVKKQLSLVRKLS